jgi:predicted permease
MTAVFRRRFMFFRDFFHDKSSDLEDELHFHLEKEVELNLARGMSPEEARRQALIAFGGVQQTRENVRQVRWTHFAEVLAQDSRYAWRMLRKSPGFSAACVAILAIGIGMNTAIFSLIEAALFRPLPAQHPEELVLLQWHAHRGPKPHGESTYGDCDNLVTETSAGGCSFSLPWLNQVRAQTGSFSTVAALAGAPRFDVSIDSNHSTTIVEGAQFVSGDFFPTLGTKASLGRLLGPGDDTATAGPVVALSDAYWKKEFNSDPGAIGRVIHINGIAFTVTGVAEPRLSGLTPGTQTDMWLPLASRSQLYPESVAEDTRPNNWWLVIVGRVAPGASVGRAKAALSLLFRNQVLHGERHLFDEADGPEIELVPAQGGLSGTRTATLKPLYILMLAVGLVLLIACANIAGLLLARSAAREREIAVRLALGAKRARLLQQLLTESLLLALTGGGLGLLVAAWGSRIVMALSTSYANSPDFAPRLDGRVLLFTAATAILTGVLFGLAPGLRSLSSDLASTLKSAASSSRQRKTWRSPGNLLVVLQVSLAVVTLMCAGSLVRTLANLKSTDLGFDSGNLLVFGVDPPQATYKTPHQMDELYRDLQERFAALPGVTSVSYSAFPLLNGWSWRTTFHPPGTPETTEKSANGLPVGPNFFKTMRIALKMGRDFSAADFAAEAAKGGAPFAQPDANSPPTLIIVNEAFVRSYLRGVNPIDFHLEGSLPSDPKQKRGPGWRIIGVVSDAKYSNLRDEISPTFYKPSISNAFFSIRSAGDPTLMVSAVREVVNRRDGALALYDIASETEKIDVWLSEGRYLARFSSFFAVLALVLACTGIYGLLSFEVARRTREIGVRMALGARRMDTIRLVLSQGLALALAGVAIGVPASMAVRRLFSEMLYGVRPIDPLTLAGVSLLLLMVALAACYLPARRATRVDPLVALRYE